MKLIKLIIQYIIYFLIIAIVMSGSSVIAKYKFINYIFLGMMCVLYNIISNKGKLKITINKKMIPICIFLSYLCFSLLYTIKYESTKQYTVIFAITILICMVSSCFSFDFWKKMMKMLMYASLIIAISILVSAVNNNFISTFFGFYMPKDDIAIDVFYGEMKQGIYSGFCFERAYAAFCLNVGLSVILSKYISIGKINKSDIAIMLILLLALFSTGKRTLFFIPIISFFLMAIVNKKKNIISIMMKIIPVICILGVLVIKFVPTAGKVFERFSDTQSADTMEIRKEEYWGYAFEMYNKSPLFGMGFATFKNYIANYKTDNVYNAHNIYVQMIGELGIIGFVILIFFFGYNYCYNLKLIKNKIVDR